ncbi:hypothetical protein H1V43_38350 [Streptomyces sp. PSKA54]|uniref:Uncharacterized protein n=1 Tax=Streptomyces himalayensis subsp. aureolus TaxID=2758039 RepID=A0A7W2D9H0_9ACTN|nr:hypothetical protein [Streptomyces himalayensis]MBA4867052.1 hypothetical protein [Streptomyces himalayensis subsp. aureolus]
MHPHDRQLVDVPEDSHNATIVLTGATTGIGCATAPALAEQAGHLILLAWNARTTSRIYWVR